MTQADRIRIMTDEELAKVLAFACGSITEAANAVWLEWLKKEVEDEHSD